MLQITPHMRLLVAVEPVDGRKGIDSLARLCRQELDEDPFSGALFFFLNRSRTTLKVLCYDGQGYLLAQKRLSEGRFKWWPTADTPSKTLEAHQVQMLLAAGNPNTDCAPAWRRISTR
ncbi:MAG: IS66 family insertion sequence element accessory protein TnpB [Candidatus Eremiobacteraeota bacterium]|nr:IS66 family insertion sequence element accessory protein TnpB [Candidatus Eremiobacteraeota bacterium]